MSDLEFPQSLFSNWLKLIGFPMGATSMAFAPSELNQAINP
jgi:hypothetical protein